MTYLIKRVEFLPEKGTTLYDILNHSCQAGIPIPAMLAVGQQPQSPLLFINTPVRVIFFLG